MKPRKIKALLLHTQLDVPLPGNNVNFKQTVNEMHHPGIKMETHPLGVLVSFKGEEFILPIVMCRIVTLEKQDAKEDN